MEELPPHDDWKAWFLQHGAKMLLCARQWTRTHADAEDVVQEAFVRFWRHQRVLGGEPLPLLLTSVRRAAIDLARRDTRRAAREDLSIASGPDTPWFEIPAASDDRLQGMEAAIRRLPEAQREILVLKIWGELTFEQIAAQLEVSPNTAASRYRYAITALRKELSSVDCHG